MFKVGDIITGIGEGLHYSLTDANAVCRVIKILNHGYIKVEVIDHKTMRDAIGDTYDVDSKYFTLLSPNIQLEAQSNDDFMTMIG